MHYTSKYFKDNIPEWKRKKDPIFTRIFYRPVSFYTASIFANKGISANSVSYISTIIGIFACLFYLVNNRFFNISGAILINIWLILDCTDGNLARSVKKQPFGEFADAISSYILVGLLFNMIGFSIYKTGGLFIQEGNAYIILLGALASSADSLMRLIYQKYLVVSYESHADTKESKEGSNSGMINKIRIRIDQEIGLGGILPIALLICTLLNCLDIVVIIWFLYYICVFLATTIYFINKVIKEESIQ